MIYFLILIWAALGGLTWVYAMFFGPERDSDITVLDVLRIFLCFILGPIILVIGIIEEWKRLDVSNIVVIKRENKNENID